MNKNLKHTKKKRNVQIVNKNVIVTLIAHINPCNILCLPFI